MADDPINFAEARATALGDARAWTPLDCLKALVRDLESGACDPVQVVYVAMARTDEKGDVIGLPYYTAGAPGIVVRGLLAQHLHAKCQEWGK